jgi:LysR family transcriptional regulator, benzoate and cis,cis-muconate-responsive activator of ben and cat genes
MELRQLRYFVAAAETGNISKAAKRIYLSQPALSRQIKALEEEIGHSLLERRANSIHLTPVGERFLASARELLRHADEVLERLRSEGKGVRLRVGYAPSLASGILSTAIGCFTQTHPDAKVELFDLSTAEMLARLEDESLDVVITVRDERNTGDLEWVRLVQADWRLAVSTGHPLARRKNVKPRDVASEPLLMLCQRDYPEYWEQVTGWLRDHGYRPRISGEYDGAESLVSAVESGLGVAIVTTRTAKLFPGRVSLKPLPSFEKPLCIAAGFRKACSGDGPLAVFVGELRRAAENAV